MSNVEEVLQMVMRNAEMKVSEMMFVVWVKEVVIYLDLESGIARIVKDMH